VTTVNVSGILSSFTWIGHREESAMPKPKAYPVSLSVEERAQLRAFTTKGVASARELRRARILLLAADDRVDAEVADAVGCCTATVARVRRRCLEEGVAAALVDRTRPGAAPLLDGKAEATLVALACTDPPGERETWTMQLLADRLVALHVVDHISDETVRRTLKKTSSNPGNAANGVSPN
jgi:transposase